MRISDLQNKDVVTINGKKIGKIIDAEINDEGIILYFVVEVPKFFRSLMVSFKENQVLFNQIKKIGEDVILVEIDN